MVAGATPACLCSIQTTRRHFTPTILKRKRYTGNPLLLIYNSILLFVYLVMKKQSNDKLDELSVKVFINEHFDYYGLKQIGFWINGEKKSDYKAQEKRICEFYGFNSIFEWLTPKIRCHITNAK